MRKKVFLTGSLLLLLLLLGGTTAYAANLDHHSRAFHQKMSHGDAWIAMIATKLNLTADDIAQIQSEIASGKTIEQVLYQRNITMDQVREALGAAFPNAGKHGLSNTKIAMIATKLGLDAGQIKEELASGKTLAQVMKDHDITSEQIESAFGKAHGLGVHGKWSRKTGRSTSS